MIIKPLEGKSFGARVEGVDLRVLDAGQFEAIKKAFLSHAFLIFPEQFLADRENVAFAERFGALEFGGVPIANQNRNEDGTFGDIIELDNQRMQTNLGNEAWHTDSSYQPISSKCAMLSAHTVPEHGGETELADTRAAYDELSDAMKARIEGLSAYHSTQYSQANDLGDFREQKAGTIYHGEAYLRPVVKEHPETGRKSLFLGRHAFGIPGLPRKQSKALLKELLDFATSEPTRVYTHSWRKGDLLLWDNRALLHRACAYDYSKPRVMIATRVAGDPASELSYYPSDNAANAGRAALARELALIKKERQYLGEMPAA